MVTTFLGPGGLLCPVCTATGAEGTCGPPAIEDILVQPLSASQWRVIDRRVPVNDACSLLGFIEEKNQQFEVMQLRHGFQWFTFGSRAEAVDHFSAPAGGFASRELEFFASLPQSQATCFPVVGE
jgi:hypothetical protein